MTPSRAEDIRGNWATLLLPIQENDAIDYGLLRAEIDHFVAAKVSGIYSNGSAGEFYTQTEDEFDRIQELLAGKCERAGMPFQIGACHPSPQLSLERVRRSRALKPSAFQVILPDWFVPTLDEMRAFLERMSEVADGIPLILYNPPHAKRRLTPDEIALLVQEFPAVVGVKLPGGDAAWQAAMLPLFAKISVFIPGHQLATGLAYGAHGAYSNVACLSPRGAQAWYDLCRRDPAAGQEAEQRIQRFWLGHVAPLITVHQLPNMAADKAAAAAGGWLPGLTPRLRWPYRSASAEQVAGIARAAREQLPEFFSASPGPI